ncbi:hypothetical protein [Microbacterium sp. JB110]|nr:hypothetical protein [Microbacterium sp. JB110]SJM59275.1 hypothetical protein CZ774_09390 [Frigoribacterium sp. JB110]
MSIDEKTPTEPDEFEEEPTQPPHRRERLTDLLLSIPASALFRMGG